MRKGLGFAMMFYASLYITNNFLIEAEKTTKERKSLYKKKIKFYSNLLVTELNKHLGIYMSSLNDEESQHFAVFTDTLQTFINLIITKDCNMVLSILNEYKDGNLMYVDEKHSKFMKQNAIKLEDL